MSPGEFQVAAGLAGVLTSLAAVDMPAVAMDLNLGLGDVFDLVVGKLIGGFECGAPTVGAMRRMNVMMDHVLTEEGQGAADPGMLAVAAAAAVLASGRPGAFGPAAVAFTLDLQFVFQLSKACVALGKLLLQVGNPRFQHRDVVEERWPVIGG